MSRYPIPSPLIKSKTISAHSVTEAATILGVLAGLGFVGWEIRNNTAVARAETRREIAAQNVEMVMRIAEDDDLMRLWSEPWTNEFVDGLAKVDRNRVAYSAIGLILRLESTYLQYEEGLLDLEGLGGYGFTQPKTGEPWFKDFWASYRPGLDPDFVEYFEALNDY